MCKNLKYISLLQSRAILAEPSKMHKNRPLAVYPATLVPLREGACPEYKKLQKSSLQLPKNYYMLLDLRRQELTISANYSKSCLYNLYTPMLANKWLMLCYIPEPTNYTRNFVDYRIKTPVLRMLFDLIEGRLTRSKIWGQVSLVLPDKK
jgi:hypothetical protein